MKHKVKAVIDGTEREIEIDLNLDEILTEAVLKQRNLLTRDEVAASFTPKDAFETELARRVASITKGKVKLEDIAEDPKLRKQVIDLLGVEVTEDGKAKLTADQVAQLQEEWRGKELGPANERAEKAEGRVTALLNRILWADIVSAAAEAKVHDHLLKPVAEGQQPPIVAMLGNIFGYDEENDNHFVRKGEDGYEFSSDPQKSGSPYKTVREFISEWATQKENEPFINAGKPGGPNLGKPGQAGGTAVLEKPTDGRPMTIQEYQAAQDAAGEGGNVVVK